MECPHEVAHLWVHLEETGSCLLELCHLARDLIPLFLVLLVGLDLCLAAVGSAASQVVDVDPFEEEIRTTMSSCLL